MKLIFVSLVMLTRRWIELMIWSIIASSVDDLHELVCICIQQKTFARIFIKMNTINNDLVNMIQDYICHLLKNKMIRFLIMDSSFSSKGEYLPHKSRRNTHKQAPSCIVCTKINLSSLSLYMLKTCRSKKN